MPNELVIWRGNPPLRTNAFHEGYLAGARATKRGPFRRAESNPQPCGSLAAEVWNEGLAAWALDRAAGHTPPVWSIR